MKIVVLLLARLGDIYMAWPALRALRRAYPDASIEVVTRPKFQVALAGLEVVDKIHLVPTTEILEPLIRLQMDPKESFDRMSAFVDQLKSSPANWVINWSFSPFSSYLAHSLTSEGTRVSGYTRFDDGFLCLPDDMSAYFYAQVGVGRANRFHLIEVMASQAELDLIPTDFKAPTITSSQDFSLPEEYVVCHIGASEAQKALSASKWMSVISHLRKLHPMHVVLIGSPNEQHLAESVMSGVPENMVINLVGKTQVSDLFPIISSAQLLVGCDSAPMHIATLTGTACLNLSLGAVNFWETGPRAMGSMIYRAASEEELPAEKVASIIHRFLSGDAQDLSVISVEEGTPSYRVLTTRQSDFDWQMIQALYMQKDFPANSDQRFNEGIQRMNEINTLMIEQMRAIQPTMAVERIAGIIERGEEVIETIAKLVPGLVVLVRWYQTEKVRIGPGTQAQVLQQTINTQEMLQKVLDLYVEYSAQQSKELA